MDIMGEIAKLKSVVLPTRAKDLYVGKGFRLPQYVFLAYFLRFLSFVIKFPLENNLSLKKLNYDH